MQSAPPVLYLFGLASLILGRFMVSPQQGRHGSGTKVGSGVFPPASSDCYIYDSATGYYYDPLAGTYYDPTTQVSIWLYVISESFEESAYNLLLGRFYSLDSLVAHYMKSRKV